MADKHTKLIGTITAMQKVGGSFVKALGSATRVADPQNRAKLVVAFPEYFKQYRAIAERNNWDLDE